MAAAYIELACNRIQEKLRTLIPSKLALAPDVDSYLTALDSRLCPYAMTWPGPGEIYQKGGGYKVDNRTFSVFVFTEALGQQSVPQRTQQGIQTLQAVTNLFIINANIPIATIADDGYQIIVASGVDSPHTDTGLTANLPFTGGAWVGFELRLNVHIQWII